MELSKFEKLVLNSIIKDDSEEDIFQQQIEGIEVLERDYTGVGVFVKFSVSDSAPSLCSSNRYMEDIPQLHLNHPELEAGAGAILWLEKGKISTLEVYSYTAEWSNNENLFTVGT